MSLTGKIQELFVRHRELALYCIIGCTGVTLDYLSFVLMTVGLGWHYQLANAIGVSIGICNNFIWNACFNFKVRDRLLLRFASFYAVGLIGMGISAGLLFVMVEKLRLNALVSKVVIIFIVTVVQYCLNKYVTFRRGRQSVRS